jgi:hypothetical protein
MRTLLLLLLMCTSVWGASLEELLLPKISPRPTPGVVDPFGPLPTTDPMPDPTPIPTPAATIVPTPTPTPVTTPVTIPVDPPVAVPQESGAVLLIKAIILRPEGVCLMVTFTSP